MFTELHHSPLPERIGAMMPATRVSTKAISLPSLKSSWRVVKEDECTTCDGVEYVKLASTNYTLAKLIKEGSGIELDNRNGIGMRSIGLNELVQTRNQKQAESFMESVTPKPACTLFAGPPDKKSKAVKSRRDIEELRKNPQTMSIPVTAGGSTRDVQVLLAVHPRDNLFVE